MKTNHSELLIEYHWGLETFVGIRDYNILDETNEIQLIEDAKV